MEDKTYSYKEIILMFGITKQTLNNWRKLGVIKYNKITRKTFRYYLPEYKNKEENEKI
jgi:DNA-binding transcriptional MerR regulator